MAAVLLPGIHSRCILKAAIFSLSEPMLLPVSDILFLAAFIFT